jgi:DNA-cytosine methyltransferase
MKILSLFDGISCARVALDRVGIPVEMYYASEIDKYAMQVSAKNYPDIVQVGSVVDFHPTPLVKVDLLIGGSPCQDLSIAKKDRKGLSGDRSSLFYEYVRILNEVKPKYFILENVASMPKEAKQTITEELFGIEPVMINASLVSAQNRKRLFWVGKLQSDGSYKQVEIPQPEDRGILLKDVLEEAGTDRLKSYCIDANYWKGTNFQHYLKKGVRQLVFNKWADNKIRDKCRALNTGCGSPTTKNAVVVITNNDVRKLTPIECERLQSLPDNYTEGVSNTQRYKALGNGFNVEVISHILKYLT